MLLAVFCPLTAYAAEAEPEAEQVPVAEDLAEPETEQAPVAEDLAEPETEQVPVVEDQTEPEAEQAPVVEDQTEPETEPADEPEQAPDAPAESPAATVSVGGAVTEYADFAAAWAAAAAAGAEATLTLLADATVTQELVLDSGNSVIFEGGEHTLTLEKGIIVGPDADPVTYTLTEQSDDKLTVNSGTIQGGEDLEGYLIDVCGGALELIDGALTSDTGDTVKVDAGTATVKDGAVTATDSESSAIVVDEIFDLGGALTVNGGTITGQEAGVFAFGDVTVTGGTISGGTGLVSQGRGEGYTGAVKTSDLVITGGAFTGTAGAGLALADDCSAVLSGGTFTGSTYALACVDEDPIVGLPIEQTLTVNALLSSGYGFFDGANVLVAAAADQKTLAGPVTVAALPASTAEPTAVPTTEPTAVPTTEPTAAPTAEPTAAPTAEPTAAPTAEPTAVPTAEPTAVPTAEPTIVEQTAEPTATPPATATPEPTVTPTLTPEPTATAAPTATAGPTAVPTATAPAAPATGDDAGLLPATLLLLGCTVGLAVILLLLRHHWEK